MPVMRLPHHTTVLLVEATVGVVLVAVVVVEVEDVMNVLMVDATVVVVLMVAGSSGCSWSNLSWCSLPQWWSYCVARRCGPGCLPQTQVIGEGAAGRAASLPKLAECCNRVAAS